MRRLAVALLALACRPPPPSSRPPPPPGEAPAPGETAAPGEPAAPAADPPPPTGDPVPARMKPLLEAHNELRARHCAPPLVWSAKVAKVALAWAEGLARRGCSFDHSGGAYGENLAGGSSGTLDATHVAEMWYGERKAYDFRSGGFSMNTGHFTQLVWRGTERLGCGTTTCKGLDLWVCNYDPPGNVDGEYRQNVLPTSCRK